MRYAQLVMGPAGSGKSTYCKIMHEHCETIKRVVSVINIDPAAEEFKYPVTADVRELIGIDDVMEAEDLKLGPNGGLVFCMEYLMKNLDWLLDQVGDEEDDDYFLIDCPGQIELYTHLPVMKTLVDTLKSWNFNVCGVFIVDAQFLIDASKYFSGAMAALSVMVQLEVPHLNIMSKMDLLDVQCMQVVETYLNPDPGLLLNDLNDSLPKKFHKLNRAIASILDDYGLVSFLPLNITNEDSINDILIYIDNAIQYGEDNLPAEVPDEVDRADEDNDYADN